MTKSYTEQLADFAAGVRYEDLSPEAVRDAKRLILDTVASSVASHYTDAGKMVAELGRDLGGPPESTILVTGQKVSSAVASYVNSSLANLMDFDDIMCHAGGHFAQSAVLPAMAVGERVGASGKDIIAAVTVGFEVTTRIGLSLRKNMVFNPETGKMELAGTAGQTWAVFGAAAAAGRLLGFDGTRMAHALGLAGYAAPIPTIGKYTATMGNWGEGSPPHGGVPMSKYTNYGALAQAGVMGALQAGKGFTGDRTFLDGERGFWKIVGSGGFDYEQLVRDLGQGWNVSETSLKPYPLGRDFQSGVCEFERLVRQNNLQAVDLKEVHIQCFSLMAEHMNHLDVHNQMDAQMNLPYAIAMIALGYPAGPEWQNPMRFEDPAVFEVMKKVRISSWPQADQRMKEEQERGVWKGAFPVRVEILTAGGDVISGEAEYTKGDPWYPEYRMTDEELAAKFLNCARGLLRTDRAREAVEIGFNLEETADVREFIATLT